MTSRRRFLLSWVTQLTQLIAQCTNRTHSRTQAERQKSAAAVYFVNCGKWSFPVHLSAFPAPPEKMMCTFAICTCTT